MTLSRITIISKENESRSILFQDIPIGPFYSSWYSDGAPQQLYLKGSGYTINLNDRHLGSFKNEDVLTKKVYDYTPVALELTVKDIK